MAVVLAVGFALTLFLSIAMVEASSSAGGDPSFGQTLVILALSFVLVLVTGLVGAMWQSGAAQAGGLLADGGRPTFRQALIGAGRVITTAVLVLVIVMVGSSSASSWPSPSPCSSRWRSTSGSTAAPCPTSPPPPERPAGGAPHEAPLTSPPSRPGADVA